jgi:hypothetical protein
LAQPGGATGGAPQEKTSTATSTVRFKLNMADLP